MKTARGGIESANTLVKHVLTQLCCENLSVVCIDCVSVSCHICLLSETSLCHCLNIKELLVVNKPLTNGNTTYWMFLCELNICRFNSITVTKISYFVLAPSKECSFTNEVVVNSNSIAVTKISNIMLVSSKKIIDVLAISE